MSDSEFVYDPDFVCACGGEMWAVEYAYPHPACYDGWSEKRCKVCGLRIGRWSGKRLEAGEVEDPRERFKESVK